MKTCRTCHKTKPLSDFPVQKLARDGRRLDCKPCYSAVAVALYWANPSKFRARSRDYQRNRVSKSAKAANQKKWTSSNRPYKNAAKAKRRALKLGSRVLACPEVKKIYQLAQRLSTNELEFEVDHITPLARGGAHVWQNMQVILASANQSKGASC